MRPLSALGSEEARGLEGLVLDLDDTVLDHGRLTGPAFGALLAASDAGLAVLLATGRPAGWGEVLARMWPVVGAVTENGAVALRRRGRGVERLERASAPVRAARRARLGEVLAEMRGRFAGLTLADDAALRHADVAIDVGESERVPAARVAEMVAFARERGVRTTVSSVHLHLSLDEDDKASGAVWFLGRELGVDPSRALARFAFVGDSGNDAACFAAFRTSFGVANVAPYAKRLSVPPRYVAALERGAGFASIVERILELRGLTTTKKNSPG